MAVRQVKSRPAALLSAQRARRAGVKRPDGERLALVADSEGAIEAVVDLDVRAGIAAAVEAGQKLEAVRAQRDRIIVGDSAQVLVAEDGPAIE